MNSNISVRTFQLKVGFFGWLFSRRRRCLDFASAEVRRLWMTNQPQVGVFGPSFSHRFCSLDWFSVAGGCNWTFVRPQVGSVRSVFSHRHRWMYSYGGGGVGQTIKYSKLLVRDSFILSFTPPVPPLTQYIMHFNRYGRRWMYLSWGSRR